MRCLAPSTHRPGRDIILCVHSHGAPTEMLSKLKEFDPGAMSPMKDLGPSETLALCPILAVHGKDGLFRGLLNCRGKLVRQSIRLNIPLPVVYRLGCSGISPGTEPAVS